MAVKPKSLLVRVHRGHNRTMSDQGELQSVRIVFLYFRKPADVSEGTVIRFTAMTEAFLRGM